MTAEHSRVGRQVAQLGQRIIHLPWRTLEHATAACAEQCVSAKQRAVPPKRDMAYRMPGHLQNLEAKSQVRQFAVLAVVDRACALRNAVVVWSDDRHRPVAQQLRDTADVIEVMVSQ